MLGNRSLIVLAICVFGGITNCFEIGRDSNEGDTTGSDADTITAEQATPATVAVDAKSTTKQARINCQLMDFVDTSDVCCPKPVDDLFPAAAQKDCNKRQDDRGHSLLNGVMLNRLQDWRNNNQLDYSGLLLGRLFGPAVCFTDCVLRVNDLMDDERVDAEKLVKYLTAGRSDPWKSILTEAVAMCKNYTDVAPVKEVTFREQLSVRRKTCKTDAVHMVQCLQVAVALNCPEELPSSNILAKKCGDSLKNLETCAKIIHKEIGVTDYLKNSKSTKAP